MTAFVIGNGISRKDIDLTKLNGDTYGCNLLYKEFSPTVLVSMDQPISKSIQDYGYPKYARFYTRHVYANTGAKKVRPQYVNWASGPNALQIAIEDDHKEIVLIGFDMNDTNIYAGKEFYNKPATYFSNWKYQLSQIFKMNDSVLFTIVESKIDIKQKNIKFITKEEFVRNYVNH